MLMLVALDHALNPGSGAHFLGLQQASAYTKTFLSQISPRV